MSKKVVANRPAFRFWFAIYGFTALILTIAVMVFAWLASESRKEAGEGRTANARPIRGQHIPDERLQMLARFAAPAYSPGREPHTPHGFALAMQRYSAGDYKGAIPGLKGIAGVPPEFVAARFYLGICFLLTNGRDRGMEQLRDVAATPPSPYIEKARFYLAKALLGEGDRSGAQRQLDVVIALQGDLETQARALLAQIQ